MEEKNDQVYEAQTYREETAPRTRGRSGRKGARIAMTAAVIALAAVTGILAFSAGKRSAPAAEPVRPAVTAQTASVENAGGKPVQLAASTEKQPASAGDSARKDTEAVFPAGDYSGRTDENGKDSDGMGLPEAGAGETLYIGYGELPHVGMTKVALVLSESGTEVHDITVFLKGFDKQLNGGALSGISSIQTSNTKAFALPVKDQPLGECTVQEITAEGDQMFVRMDYSFRYYAVFGSDSQLIHLGEMELWLKKAG